MSRILIGTASWTDKSLIDCGRFYPKDCTTAEGRLRFYASKFPLVEVDSSYYALPSAKNAELWTQRAPRDFVFNVKAFRALTHHQTPPKALPADLRKLVPTDKPNLYARDMPAEVTEELWKRFLEGVRPLVQTGKLGALHFQFPPWFTAKSENYSYLEQVRERVTRYSVALEFRHRSWFDKEHVPATLAFEGVHGFVNVTVDEPQGSANSIPAVWDVTNPKLAVIRLHGRNVATWNQKGLEASSERFNYDYSQEELTGLAESIRKVSVLICTQN